MKDEEKGNKAYILHLPAVESEGSTRYDKGNGAKRELSGGAYLVYVHCISDSGEGVESKLW